MTTVGRGAVAADAGAAAASAVNAPEPPPMPAVNGGADRRRSTGGGTSREPAPFQGRENWRLAPHGTNDYNGSRMSAGGRQKQTAFTTALHGPDRTGPDPDRIRTAVRSFSVSVV